MVSETGLALSVPYIPESRANGYRVEKSTGSSSGNGAGSRSGNPPGYPSGRELETDPPRLKASAKESAFEILNAEIESEEDRNAEASGNPARRSVDLRV